MNKNSLKIKRLVGLSILTALVIILQVCGNYITIGTVNITLALTPIALGAILYGPVAGLYLGAVMGCVVLFASQAFIAVNPFVTIVLCLLKTGIAGLLSGFLYKGISHFANKEKDTKIKRIYIILAVVASCLIIPIVNTLIFVCGASIFFYSIFGLESTKGAFGVIFGAVFTTNFAIEFALNVVLTPAVLTILKVITRNYNLGFSNDFSSLETEEENNNTSFNTYSDIK